MSRRLALAGLIALLPAVASAQMALIAPTAPNGDNSDRIANTAFVQAATGGSLALQSGRIFIGSASNVATPQTFSGDGTLSIAGVFALASVNTNVGSFGSATQCPTVTVNAKGQVTAASAATCTPAASSITGGAALTGNNDTNVTVTLGGAPASSLLAATSITLGWTGTLSVARGGTGQATSSAGFSALAPTPTRIGDVLFWNGTAWVTLAGNNSGTQFLQETSAGVPSWATVAGTGTLTTLTAGAGISFSSGATCTTSCTVSQSLTNATLQSTTLSPTGTASTTAVMMGLGTTCHITPTYSGRVEVNFRGTYQNAVAGANTVARAMFGTGTAPANGAASTGTQIGAAAAGSPGAANGDVSLAPGGVLTGLTVGTPVWFDIGLNVASGSGTPVLVSCDAHEF